jgi:tripartite-type tricarboxylate transporter receptor subunit TctC
MVSIRKRNMMAAVLGAALSLGTALATAQERTIRIIVPFAAGGATDALARTIANRLGQELAQSVIVENKPGAGGQIGTAFVKSAPADGSVYLFTPDHTIVTIPHLVTHAGYEALKDFVAVGQVARFPLALAASPSTGAKTLAEFAAYLKANPDKASYGVPVVGGFPSTVGSAVARKVGVPMIAIPFAGSGPAVMNAAGGQVASSVTGLADALPLAKAGRVHIVAITGTRRSGVLPEVPTFEELGYPGLDANSWYAFFAPKALPAAAAQKFNQALGKAMNAPDVQQKIADLSIEFAPTTLSEADAEFKAAAAYWAKASQQPDFVRP